MDAYDKLLALNLNSLHTFLLVAHHRSFRRVAELSHRSHSAVSAQIKALEEQVGTSLLHRTTRSVALTSSGEVLLEAVEAALGELSDCVRRLQESDSSQFRNVQLACSPLMAENRLPEILAAFERTYPHVRVHLHELSENWGDMVRTRQVDFAVAPSLAAETELSFERLFVDPIVALAPIAQCRTDQSAITLLELSKKPLLLQAGLTRQLLEYAARERGIALR
ncbi:MAG: LysR family transcriptional regulator [Lautropia sp.]